MRFLTFIATFAALFALTVGFLAAVDALPEPLDSLQSDSGQAARGTPRTQNITHNQSAEVPVRIVAESIGMDVKVNNPTQSDIETLDKALLTGAVRYPDSALLGQSGTVLIFGHSSYVPVIYNQAYKAFNGIQHLKAGDTVRVYSGSAEHRYRVTGVRLADASEDVVELRSDGTYLTLVTCDSFGRKTDRFVITAEFVDSNAL